MNPDAPMHPHSTPSGQQGASSVSKLPQTASLFRSLPLASQFRLRLWLGVMQHVLNDPAKA
eukprot:CAMPEP_0174385780 /NCGR_PEP_ID=MMETSP0811_2-20130205/126835_1 /TAXON_ID=73025 ORGANISM="Eutreptiella gymnastica-like, Strain CCMP1594" /NCGR_SAMPLE_ID=MMETSP0811_2 /ASSEMBLY_ACC=CAM_ASM_000667 /LENGTH=60 /DNA_ID=CAMNT_0015540229 /DNA_START=1265 /DNA_END=1447 /DNA_ORIENTATION=-